MRKTAVLVSMSLLILLFSFYVAGQTTLSSDDLEKINSGRYDLQTLREIAPSLSAESLKEINNERIIDIYGDLTSEQKRSFDSSRIQQLLHSSRGGEIDISDLEPTSLAKALGGEGIQIITAKGSTISYQNGNPVLRTSTGTEYEIAEVLAQPDLQKIEVVEIETAAGKAHELRLSYKDSQMQIQSTGRHSFTGGKIITTGQVSRVSGTNVMPIVDGLENNLIIKEGSVDLSYNPDGSIKSFHTSQKTRYALSLKDMPGDANINFYSEEEFTTYLGEPGLQATGNYLIVEKDDKELISRTRGRAIVRNGYSIVQPLYGDVEARQTTKINEDNTLNSKVEVQYSGQQRGEIAKVYYVEKYVKKGETFAPFSDVQLSTPDIVEEVLIPYSVRAGRTLTSDLISDTEQFGRKAQLSSDTEFSLKGKEFELWLNNQISKKETDGAIFNAVYRGNQVTFSQLLDVNSRSEIAQEQGTSFSGSREPQERQTVKITVDGEGISEAEGRFNVKFEDVPGAIIAGTNGRDNIGGTEDDIPGLVPGLRNVGDFSNLGKVNINANILNRPQGTSAEFLISQINDPENEITISPIEGNVNTYGPIEEGNYDLRLDRFTVS